MFDRAEEMPRGAGGRHHQLRRSVQRLWNLDPHARSVAVAYLASRVVVLFVAKASTWYADGLSVVEGLTGWDGGWYLRIAESGYASNLVAEGGGNRWGFFPGLPGLIRLVHAATPLSWQVSGLVVAFVLGLFGVLAVYLAAKPVFGAEVAAASAVLMCFLPNAYVLSMVYTDGLFLACAGLCLYFLGRRRWELAGLAAAVAGLTRSTALVLVACCAFEAVLVGWRERSLRPLAAPLIAPLGLLAFMAYGWARIDEPLAFVTAQEAWSNQFDWFRPVIRGVSGVLSDTATWQDAQAVLATLALLVTAAGLVALARSRVPAVWWVYTVGIVVVALTPYWLTSVPRYLLAAFPLVAALLSKLPKSTWSTLTSTSAVAMGALAFGAFSSVALWQTAPLAP